MQRKIGGVNGSTKTLPVGISVRSGVVHALQLKPDNGHYVCLAAASEPLSAGEELVDPLISTLRRLFDQYEFKGNKVVSALPASDVEIRPLRLPKGITPGGPGFEQALMSEARSCLLYDPAEAVLDYLPFVGDTLDADQRQMVLLIASRRERVNRFLAIFHEAGLHCEHLEVAACAAARVLRKLQGFYAIVDIDRNQTVISVAESHRMLFSRTVKVGYGEWIQRVSQALDLSMQAAQDLLQDVGMTQVSFKRIDLDAVADTGLLSEEVVPAVLHEVCSRSMEQLTREIRRTTDYFALLPGGGRVEQICLLGELFPKSIQQTLEDRLQVPVSLGAPQSELDASPLRAVFTPRWTIAQGLALRGFQ